MDPWFVFALLRLQVDAVRLIAEGKAPRIIQPQEGATYECIQKKDNSQVMHTDIETDGCVIIQMFYTKQLLFGRCAESDVEMIFRKQRRHQLILF